MKIVEICLYVAAFGGVWYFSDLFPQPKINFGFIILFMFLISHVIFSSMINGFKLKSKKIVGTGINSSFISEGVLPLSNGFYAVGLGGYTSDFIGSKKQTDGVLVVHESLITEVHGNYVINGLMKPLMKAQIMRYEWISILDKFFSKTSWYFAEPVQEIKINHGNTKSFISAILAELKTLTHSNNKAWSILEMMQLSHSKLDDMTLSKIKQLSNIRRKNDK